MCEFSRRNFHVNSYSDQFIFVLIIRTFAHQQIRTLIKFYFIRQYPDKIFLLGLS